MTNRTRGQMLATIGVPEMDLRKQLRKLDDTMEIGNLFVLWFEGTSRGGWEGYDLEHEAGVFKVLEHLRIFFENHTQNEGV